MGYNSESKNVLVLEDIASEQARVAEIVTSLGYAPLTASSRQDFLGLMKANDYLAAILDNNAPYDRDGELRRDVGLMLANHFLRHEPGLKVALHTENEKTERINGYIRRGLVYMKKPASAEDIRKFLA